MQSNQALISRLYAGLSEHDAQKMSSCYGVEARFRDIAFDLSGQAEISAMWRMITSGDIRVTVERVEASDEEGSAEIIDDYTFQETGRHVRNRIISRFRFRDSLIIDHQDECDPKVWAAQALGGITGMVAGRIRFLRAWKARALLRNFDRKSHV